MAGDFLEMITEILLSERLGEELETTDNQEETMPAKKTRNKKTYRELKERIREPESRSKNSENREYKVSYLALFPQTNARKSWTA